MGLLGEQEFNLLYNAVQALKKIEVHLDQIDSKMPFEERELAAEVAEKTEQLGAIELILRHNDEGTNEFVEEAYSAADVVDAICQITNYGGMSSG